jgi:predicted transcriptional regulator
MTWIDEEVALLRTMRADGASLTEMSRRLGRPKSQISRKIEDLGLPLAFGVRTVPTYSGTHAEPKAKPLRRGARTLPDLA